MNKNFYARKHRENVKQKETDIEQEASNASTTIESMFVEDKTVMQDPLF